MFELIVHGCMHGGIEVLAFGERFDIYAKPGPVALFGIDWFEGTVQRDGFEVNVPSAALDGSHYDLIIEGDDLQTARVGIRPRRGSQPDPAAEVLWATQDV